MKYAYFIFAILLTFSAHLNAGEEVSPKSIEGAITIDTAKAKQLFDDGAAFIDTRKDSDWSAGRIPDAIHLELKSIFSAESLGAEVKQKTDPIVCYCNGHKCMRSSKCSTQAVAWGYKNVYYYRDGFPAWKEAKHPVE